MKAKPLSEKGIKVLAQTRARFVYWVAYGVTFSLVYLPLIVLGILAGDHYCPYITGIGFGLASALATVGAKAAVKRIGNGSEL